MIHELSHELVFSSLESRILHPGLFSHTNPTYHSKERTKDDIFYWATETFNNLSYDEQKELAEDFPDYHHQDSRFEIPEFQLVHCTIAGKSSGGKVETEAYEVQIERQHGKIFKRVMELTFKSATSNDILFIPFALKRELSGDEYSSIIRQQSIYLENHHNISSIVRISNRRMLMAVTYDNVKTSFKDLLKSREGVYHVDSTKQTPGLGKWNISTNKDHYSDLTILGSTRFLRIFLSRSTQTILNPWTNSLSRNASYNTVQPEQIKRLLNVCQEDSSSFLHCKYHCQRSINPPPSCLESPPCQHRIQQQQHKRKIPPSTNHQTFYLRRYTLHSFFHTPDF
jgi:hypothetical protein